MTSPVSSPSISDVLERAADRLSKPGAWVPGGGSTPDVACAALAIDAAARTREAGIAAREAFARFIGAETARGGIWRWNDEPGRTQDEVVTALRNAAKVARGDHV